MLGTRWQQCRPEWGHPECKLPWTQSEQSGYALHAVHAAACLLPAEVHVVDDAKHLLKQPKQSTSPEVSIHSVKADMIADMIADAVIADTSTA